MWPRIQAFTKTLQAAIHGLNDTLCLFMPSTSTVQLTNAPHLCGLELQVSITSDQLAFPQCEQADLDSGCNRKVIKLLC